MAVMDPNETLAWLREQLSHVNNLTNIDEVAERFNKLDEWLSQGGFMPAAWDYTEQHDCYNEHGGRMAQHPYR